MPNLITSLSLKDTIFDPDNDERVAYVRQPKSQQPLYKVWLYLDGPSLPFVERVTYTLHPTFPQPVRTVPRTVSNPRCGLVIWTWGTFTVKALVEDKQGNKVSLEQYLTYGKQVQQKGVKFVSV